MEAVLTTCNSLIVFRRRYRSFMELSSILELLLLDEHYPRSLACQLRQLQFYIATLPRETGEKKVYRDETLIASTREELSGLDQKWLAGHHQQ